MVTLSTPPLFFSWELSYLSGNRKGWDPIFRRSKAQYSNSCWLVVWIPGNYVDNSSQGQAERWREPPQILALTGELYSTNVLKKQRTAICLAGTHSSLHPSFSHHPGQHTFQIWQLGRHTQMRLTAGTEMPQTKFQMQSKALLTNWFLNKA